MTLKLIIRLNEAMYIAKCFLWSEVDTLGLLVIIGTHCMLHMAVWCDQEWCDDVYLNPI